MNRETSATANREASRVTVSLGSNINPSHHIRQCLDAMSVAFGPLMISRIFESEPVGFQDARNFYNLVVAFNSDWSPGTLQRWAKALETAHGRTPDMPKFSPRALDIDLLTVGDHCGLVEGVLLPRDEIEHNAFVLQPLAELLPDQYHPRHHTPYAAMWDAFELNQQRLWPIDFTWQGQLVSQADPCLGMAAQAH